MNDNRDNLIERIKKSFHRLFSFSHLIYTTSFFLIIIVITMLSLFPDENIGNIVLFVTITFTLMYLVLMFIDLDIRFIISFIATFITICLD